MASVSVDQRVSASAAFPSSLTCDENFQQQGSAPEHTPSCQPSVSDAATLIMSNLHSSTPLPSPPNDLPASHNRRAIFGDQIQRAIRDQKHGAAVWNQGPTPPLSNDTFGSTVRRGEETFQSDSCLYQFAAVNQPPENLTPPGSPLSYWKLSRNSRVSVDRNSSRKMRWLRRLSDGESEETEKPKLEEAHQGQNGYSSIRQDSDRCVTGLDEDVLNSSICVEGSSMNQRETSGLSLHSHYKRPHETRHAQSLLLGLAFCAVWSSSNLMAPNLTEIAATFGWTDPEDRDLYLGSYVALATGVLSFPIAAAIGVAADLTQHRQRLFVATVALNALATAAAAASRTYRQFIVARLCTGGCMAGSVPVAFSFLGDLFSVDERNAASSGLTACMGLGIVLGQIYAGSNIGETWRHPFWASACFCVGCAGLCACLVSEPVRGGKEAVLQNMFRQTGKRYDRKLTWSSFYHAMKHNNSNRILLWQGFFSNLPWGIIFVFLNDYLSQERGFSVPDATFLVLVFASGSAVGGIFGGYVGQKVQSVKRSYLPLFMATSTAAGVLPFTGFLNSNFTDAHGIIALFWSFSSGLIASLPAVNVRPCLLNVNAPETRGAALTAANLLITLGRGIGPSCITVLSALFGASRKQAFNITIAVFWTVSAIQLLFLVNTLPHDQDAMEAELAEYAKEALESQEASTCNDDCETVVSIEDRITSFDGTAAKQTLVYVREGIKEISEELNPFRQCGSLGDDDETEDGAPDLPSETTPLIV